MTLALALMATIATNAQVFGRLEVGGNFSNITKKINDKSFDMDMLFGGRAGLGLEVFLAPNFYLGTALNYRMGGANEKENKFIENIKGLIQEKGDLKVRKHSVTLPVNIGLRAEIVPAVAISVEGGPYVAYTFKTQSTLGVQEELQKLLAEPKFTDNLEVGVGLSVAASYQNFYLRLGTDYGLTNVSKFRNQELSKTFKDLVDVVENNTEFYLTAGIRF